MLPAAMRYLIQGLAAAIAMVAATSAHAQPTPTGFLCCNLRTDGSWISDINYEESHKTMIPVGTPVKVTGYGRYRVRVEISGKNQAIGNDYSRTLDLEAFMKRYVVADDPNAKIASFPPKIQQAIKTARLRPGMTREQVIMSVGWPVTSENPNVDAKLWRMWLWSFSEFQVVFGDDGKVKEINTDPATRVKIVME